MKKRFIGMLALSLAVIMSLTGCKSADKTGASGDSLTTESDIIDNIETTGDTQLDDVKEKGKLVIGVEGQKAPWNYHENDTLTGYDVEVAKAVADKLGLEPEYVEGTEAELFSQLDAGTIDVIVSGIEISDKKGELYEFTVPYAYVKSVLVVSKSNNEISEFVDISGKLIAAQAESPSAVLATEYGAVNDDVNTLAEGIEKVVSGSVDAAIYPEESVNEYLKQNPDAEVEIVSYSTELSQVAIPISRSQIELKEAIDKAFDELSGEGVLTQLAEKYFGKDISVRY